MSACGIATGKGRARNRLDLGTCPSSESDERDGGISWQESLSLLDAFEWKFGDGIMLLMVMEFKVGTFQIMIEVEKE